MKKAISFMLSMVLVLSVIPVSKVYAVDSIKSISAVMNSQLIENYSGYNTVEYSSATESYVEYFKYSWDDKVIYTVTRSDDTAFTGDRWAISEEFGEDVSVSDNQGPDNQWGVCVHTGTVIFGGQTCQVQIEIAENPVESVSVVMTKQLVEHTDTNMFSTTVTDEETGEPVEVFYEHYYWMDYAQYTVVRKDGQVFTGTDTEIREQSGENVFYTDNQSYENQWGIGTHTVTVSFMGVSCDFQVEIIESPVISISAVQTKPVVEGVDARISYDGINDKEYVRYDWTDAIEITVVYGENEVFVGDINSIYDLYGMSAKGVDDQSADNEWGVGIHTAELKYMGKTCQVQIEIIENPIESISATQTKDLIEGADCFETVDLVYNPETDTYEETRYYNYSWSGKCEYTVTYDGGKTFTGTENEICDKFGESLSTRDDQSYENQWMAGIHTGTVRFMGRSCEVELVISSNPISSISAVLTQPIYENIDCYKVTYSEYDEESGDWLEYSYYHYDWQSKCQYTVNYVSGDTFVGTLDQINENFGYEISASDSQCLENPWAAGNYTGTVNFMGKSCDVDVTISPNPIESVSAVMKQQITVGTNKTTVHEWDHESGTPVSYEKYDWRDSDLLQLTVVCNGVVYSGNEYEIQEQLGFNCSFEYSDDQSDTNEWGIGIHTGTVSLAGKSCQVSIEIIEAPIKSISATLNGTLIENTDGSYAYEWIYDPETGEGTKVSYFRYNWQNKIDEYTVTYTDGTTFTGNSWQIYDKFGEWVKAVDDQSYYNQWGVGTYTGTVSLMDKECEVTITIVESPVESISAVMTSELLYLTDGWTSSYWEDETEYEYFNYYWSDKVQFTVTYNGGSVFVGGEDELYRLFGYSPETHDDQSYNNQWGIGSHTGNVTFMGAACSVNIEVEDNYIANISATPKRSIYLGLDCDTVDRLQDNDISYLFDAYTVTYKNGKTLVCDASKLYKQYGVSPQVYIDIPLTNDGTGLYDATIKLGGMKFSTQVNVVENPYTAVSLSENDGFLYLTFTKNDSSTVTAKVLTYDGYNTVKTDIGSFYGTFSTDENDITKNVKFTMGDMESNILESSQLVKIMQCGTQLANAFSCYEMTEFNGTITADNIDKIIAFAYCAAESFRQSGEVTMVEIDGDYYYLIDAETVKSIVSMFFDITGVDFAMAKTDEETGKILVGLSMAGNFGSEELTYDSNADKWTYYFYYYKNDVTTATVIDWNAEGKITRMWTKTASPTPSYPEIASRTENSVTLVANEGYEYRINDGEWQQSNIFTGLTAEGEYYFYQRVAETEEKFASDESAPLVVAAEYVYTIQRNKVTILKYCDSTATELEVPTELSGYPVKYIGDNTFQNCTELKNIYIHKNIISIEGNAFNGCIGLTIHGYSGTPAQTVAENSGLAFVSMGSVVSGDVDLDGVLTENDYAKLWNVTCATGTVDERALDVADLNGDGAVDGFDVLTADLILKGYM